MSDDGAPQAIQMLDDLLGVSTPSPSKALASPPPAAVPPPASNLPIAAAPANAAAQAAPGTTPPAGKPGPQVPQMPTIVPRGTVTADAGKSSVTLALDGGKDFEENLARLLTKDLELAQHDRSMAIALFQTHLDRAEVLDGMQLSMPVATVIADNTGATLKSLELAMKAGERVHKVAELLVNAQKNSDAATLAALKIKQGNKDNDGGWGDEVPK